MTVQVTLQLPQLKKNVDDYGHVRRLQEILNIWVGPAEEGAPTHFIDVDGEFGPATEGALKIFQGQQNLTRDGVVGPRTWSTLLSLWVSGVEPG